MAFCTVVIFSASSSGISMPNSSSRAMTSSTVSRESAPRSATKAFSLVTWDSSTPSCSAMIFLTRASISLMGFPQRVVIESAILSRAEGPAGLCPGGWVDGRFSGHEHAAVDVDLLAGHVARLRRHQPGHRVCDVGGLAQVAQRDLAQQCFLLVFGECRRHVGLDESGSDA